jgi:hypothetical protein
VAGDGGGTPVTKAKIYVGKYVARSSHVADTDPSIDILADAGRVDAVVRLRGFIN